MVLVAKNNQKTPTVSMSTFVFREEIQKNNCSIRVIYFVMVVKYIALEMPNALFANTDY